MKIEAAPYIGAPFVYYEMAQKSTNQSVCNIPTEVYNKIHKKNIF